VPAVVHDRVGEALTIALAGNPNCGKSTIFNALTGARQHVGNWPGKTVEKREGYCTIGEYTFMVVDLPGTYSLSAYSAEEIIAMDFLLEEQPDVVIAVLDAGNLERNLYLAVQTIEMGLNVIVVLNMMDGAQARGINVDCKCLSAGLGGVPVIPMVATRGHVQETLKAPLLNASQQIEAGTHHTASLVNYGPVLEKEIARLAEVIARQEGLASHYLPRWLAIKLLEDDPHIIKHVEAEHGTENLLAMAHESVERLRQVLGDEPEIVLADCRYAFIHDLVQCAVTRPPEEGPTLSDRIDSVVTHPLLGLPIFAAAMWIVFQMTINVSAHYLDWIDGVVNGPIAHWAAALLRLIGLGGTWVESLVVNGVIAGTGSVLVFVPVLGFMYFFLALLEDSGYMARATLFADRFMRLIGLHGRSFIPMLLGFGCSVPGIYATRTLADQRDRLLTGLLVPFMSCGARLPVYVILGVALFGARAGALVFALYITGAVVGILVGILLKRTIFRSDEPTPFIIELPPYRLPLLKNVLLYTWENVWAFVQRAWTVILAASVLIWLLLAVPVGAPPGTGFAQAETEHSALAALSRWLAPIFRPAGYGTWEASSALMTGFVAKEVIVSTLAQVYLPEVTSQAPASVDVAADLAEIGRSFIAATTDTLRALGGLIPGVNLFGVEGEQTIDPTLATALQGVFTPLSAVAFCVFVLLTAPCVTTMTALAHEFGVKWMAFSVGMMLVLAWAASTIVYQVGLLFGLG
jgi:ferrous iron transport protein B